MTARISRNAVLSFAAQAVPMVAAVASVPLLVRFLGTERVGLLSMVWVLISYFSALDIGISAAVTRSASMALADSRPGSLGPLIWSALALQMTMGALGATVLIAAAPFLANRVFHIPAEMIAESVSAIRICALGLPVVLLSGSVTGVLQAALRFGTLAKVQAPIGSAQYAIPAILAWQGAKLPVIVLVLVLLRLIALAVTSYQVIQLFPDLFHPTRVQLSQITKLLSFGIWIMISAIVSPLLVFADRFLIANRLNLADVAYYSIPLDAVIRLLLFSSSLTTVLYPAFSSLTSELNAARTGQIARKSLKFILCGTGIPAILIWIFSYDIMRVWINPSFALHSAPVLRILIFGVLANAIARVPFALLQSHGYPRITALVQVVSLPVQVIASLYLMTLIGIRGVAVSWSFRLLLETGFLFYFAKRMCAMSIKQAWAENKSTLWTLGYVSAAGALLGAMAGSNVPARAVLFILVMISGSVLLWYYALNSQDRGLIRNGLKRGGV
jgi:O-antigen/teichoic acid export membrane protein